MVEAIRQKMDRTALILFVSAFIYLCIWVTPININSDGLDHLSVGRGIADDGALLELAPHTTGGIAYPETFHVMLALVYMWGGEGMVKFLSPICGALIALFIYLMLKPVNRCLGVLSGVFATGFLTHIFLNPLLEPYLLAGAIMAMYFCYLFFKTEGKKYLWLAALFLGLSMSIKQPGLMLFGVVIVVGIVLALYMLLKRGHRQLLNSVPLLAIVPIAISFAPLRDHIERNGALYPGGLNYFHYIHWRGYEAISRIAKEYLVGPAFWERPESWVSLLVIPILVLFILGAIYLYKRDRLLTYILLPVLVGEVLLALMAGRLIRHYHVIGIAIAPVFLMSSIFFVRKVMNLRLASLFLATLLVIFGVSGVFLYNEGWWGDSGRYDDQHISMYKEVGEFIQGNIPHDAIYLAGTEGFSYYSLKGGGTRVWIQPIFEYKSEQAAVERLRGNNIDYIFLETRQIEKESEWRDYVPSDGLAGYIDESPYFEEVFSVQSDEGDAFILYHVLANIDGDR